MIPTYFFLLVADAMAAPLSSGAPGANKGARARANYEEDRYSIVLSGNPAKDENKKLDRKPVALNGNPARRIISRPDYILSM